MADMRSLGRAIGIVGLVFCASVLLSVSVFAQADLRDQLLSFLNGARLDQGLAPLGLSERLSAAAQRHAEDLVTERALSHAGADGSTPEQRVARAGYAAWILPDGSTAIAESLWSGSGSAEDATNAFMNDEASRSQILSTIYREIGVGVAEDSEGVRYVVLVFGVHPNVLPIFINDGAPLTDSPQVAVRLTNEEARPDGQGNLYVGSVIEYRISNEPVFEERPWQAWKPLVPWSLPDVVGEHTVYVEYRDAAGRTAKAADSIYLGDELPPTPVPVAAPADEEATPDGEQGSSSTEETPPREAGVGTPAASLSEPVGLQGEATPFPTWTPLPTPTDDSQPEVQGSEMSIPLLLALQAVAWVLGLYLVLRRRRPLRKEG